MKASPLRRLISNHRYLASALISVMAMVIGIRTFELFSLLSPATKSLTKSPQTSLAKPSPAQSLAELYQLQDYLHREIDRFSTILDSTTFVDGSEYKRLRQRRETLIAQLQTVEAQIQINQDAEASWKKSVTQATLAAQTGRLPGSTLETWKQAQVLWEESIDSLYAISPTSFIGNRAIQKAQEYEKYLSTTNYKLEIAQSRLLGTILKQSGLSPKAMITVCKLPGECRHWQGNQPPATPASLSKIPIAVALMHKVSTENISLDTPIYVESGNFTEDGRAQLQVRRRYPLNILLTEMIRHSSNIASNQLIDYLGWDYMDRVFKKRGYRVTRVSSKFRGQKVTPAKPGKASNRLTTNELTRMMLDIYNRKYPGDEVLIKALSQQRDRSLGFSALKDAPAQWLGEKTGETSKVRGTTLAFSLAGETYIVTLIDNRGYRDANLRHCLTQIANYIAQYGYF